MGAHTGRRVAEIATPKRGEVWRVAFDAVRGSEHAKTRRAVVVQRDAANVTSPTTIVCPLIDAHGATGNLLNVLVKKGEGGTTKASLVVCNQVRVIGRVRLTGGALGTLSDKTMELVAEGLRAILDL